jgi:hypothetical protein
MDTAEGGRFVGRALFALLFAFLALIPAAAGPLARADDGAPTTPQPPPNPGTPVGPPMTPLKGSPMLSSQIAGSPSDYHFTHFQLYGMFFNPGEQVTITAEHVAISPITVTADQNGQFFAYVDFTWMFCGPAGTSDPAPVFHAGGNMGSSDTLAIPAQPCPELVASQQLAVEPPGGSGGGVISGTAVAGTAVPVTVGVSTVVPPGEPPVPLPGGQPTPQPLPGTTAIQTTNIVQGFGFRPGEGVSVREVHSPGDTPAPVSATADSQGQFRATVQVYVPGPCMGVSNPPEIVATGDKGTSASARPAYPPMPMYPCIAPQPTVVPPAVPAPSSVTNAGHPSLSLRPKVATAGAVETARIQAPSAGKVRLSVTYPHHGTARWTVTAQSPAFQVRWTIPRTAKPGRARFSARFPDNSVLRKSFTIR